MISASQEIQDWFTACAGVISKDCRSNVSWITPLGFPVIQPYSKVGDDTDQSNEVIHIFDELKILILFSSDVEVCSQDSWSWCWILQSQVISWETRSGGEAPGSSEFNQESQWFPTELHPFSRQVRIWKILFFLTFPNSDLSQLAHDVDVSVSLAQGNHLRLSSWLFLDARLWCWDNEPVSELNY